MNVDKNQIRFIVDIVDHCNLNCKGCGHFSPLASESFLDIETFENDFMSDEEIDFHQDFFPKIDIIKFTDLLVDDWKDKIHQFYERIYQNISKIKNI